MNDIHILDTATSTWTCPHIGGVLPHPRAGMTLTAIKGRLYLFGGSGSSSKCFQDLQILDRKQMVRIQQSCDCDLLDNTRRSCSYYRFALSHTQMWLDVMQNESSTPARSNDAQPSDNFQVRSYTASARSSESSGPEEWRARRNALNRRGSAFANPNDEDAVPTIVVEGQGPGRRAGHTATAVNRRYLYVFGGSCGSDYLVSSATETFLF